MSFHDPHLSRALVDILLLGIAAADAQQAHLAVLVSTVDDATVPPPADESVALSVDVTVDAA